MKKILNFQKEKNGNISILVLIMSMAIILLTTAMVGYIFHDIGFTELDKGELRALHFAESGLSNMYYKIESGEDLPDSPYTLDIGDPDPEGRFEVEYEIENKGGLEFYIITSTGVDISSGATRKVKVGTIYINIYDFIFSGRASGAGQLSGQISVIGPFFVANIIDDELLGNSSFKKGPLFVKGDISISGNASIGEPEGVGYGPIILVLGGLINDELFDPENPPDDVYVSEYYHKAIDVTFPIIDDSYIALVVASGALVIPGNLFIGDGEIIIDNPEFDYELLEGYLEFNGSILEIDGNIVVYGYIEIGGKNDTIYYSGNGNLISTGDIAIRGKVRPENMNNFPSIDLMALISQNNIDLYAKNGNYEEPDAAVMLIAGSKIETQSTNTFLRGGTVSNILTLKQNATIYYETGIGEYLTGAIPGFGENIRFQTEWKEIIAD
ncbi:MAG: hypothetical protein IMZ51_02795 [Chloroflexi bacterium]|nr:hypothetical protein [Chloroflexota bacterium]